MEQIITQKNVDNSLKQEVDIGIFKNSDRIISGVDHLIDIKPFPITYTNQLESTNYEELFKSQIKSEKMKKWMDSQKNYVNKFIENDKKNNNNKELIRFRDIYLKINDLNTGFNAPYLSYPRYLEYYNSELQKKFLNFFKATEFADFQKFIMDSPPTTEDMYIYRWVGNIKSDVCSKSNSTVFNKDYIQFGQTHNFLSTTWSPYFGGTGQQAYFIRENQPTLLRIFVPKGSHILVLPTKQDSEYIDIYNLKKYWVNYNELEIMFPMFSYLYKKPCTDIPTEKTITYGGPFLKWGHQQAVGLFKIKMIDCCFSNTMTPEYEIRIIESYILDPTIENFINLPYSAKSKIISSVPKDHWLYKTIQTQYKAYVSLLEKNQFLKQL